MSHLDPAYKQWIFDLKEKVRSAQLKAAVAVNTQLIQLYWDLGQTITEKQTAWGTGFLQQLSNDLSSEFPDMKGFSYRNLALCRQFFQFYSSPILQQPVAELENAQNGIWQQAVAQIPWGHNILIFTKSSSVEEAQFYVNQTIQNGWSRNVLTIQLKTNLYERAGKAINNFNQTLTPLQSALAQETLKDPYAFDFISIAQPYRERGIISIS